MVLPGVVEVGLTLPGVDEDGVTLLCGVIVETGLVET